MKIKVGLVQFARLEDGNLNVKKIQELLLKIKSSRIVCLPEAWAGRGKILTSKELEEICLLLGEIAAKKGFYLILGGLFIQKEGKVFSSCPILNDKGLIEGFTDKIFPSLAVGERGFCNFGETLNVFSVDEVTFGVAICVDAFYPEVVRTLALKGAKIVFNPSNIPLDRINLWKCIGRVRASENTIFYVFINSTLATYPNGRRVAGQSFIVNPNGDIIFQAGEEEGVFELDLDLSQIDEIRKRWPYLSDIRERKFAFQTKPN
ncbi:MAG: carbon-nitrogen hydrolase family protein [Candidatus Bathyarchaeota archaeon]